MKIGLLLPRSILYPALSFDIVDGLKSLFELRNVAGIEFTTKSIDLGAKYEEIYAAAEQMLLSDTDIIVTYINPKAAEFIHSLFESSGKLLLLLDSAYHYPSFNKKLSHAITISLQGALNCRLAARIAVTEGSREFAYTSSFFDAGYRVANSFVNSLDKRGGKLVHNYIAPLRKSDYSLQGLSNFVSNNKPDAIFAAYCGDMTEDFLREAGKNDLFTTARIYGSPFMGEEIWLNKIDYPGGDWICVVPWARGLNIAENDTFISKMDGFHAQKANLFSVLGWEAGEVISEIIIAGISVGQSTSLLEGKTILSPRGNLYINGETHIAEAPAYLAKVIKNETSGKCKIDYLAKISFIDEERPLHEADIQGVPADANAWLNAYACLDS